MTADSNNLDYALLFVREWGFPVFPLKERGKTPATSSGSLDATFDERTVRDWWTNNPNLNIGIATGKRSRLVVVDIDSGKGANAADLIIDGVDHTIFNTVKVKTGAGLHLYYRLPDGIEIKNSASKLGEFIDVRGEGGYVVAPPSIHENGKVYEFHGDYDTLLEFPRAWIEKINQKNQPKTSSVSNNDTGFVGEDGKIFVTPIDDFTMPDLIGDGKRNQTMTQIAGKLKHFGLSSEAIENALLIENQKICRPPLSNSEIHKIVVSVARYDQDKEFNTVTDDSITNCDDISIALRFANFYLKKLKYNNEARKWLIWDGARWAFDRKEEIVRIASEFAQKLYNDAPALVTKNADMTSVMRQIKRSNTNTGLQAFINISKSYLGVSSEELDTHNYLLNCKNGTVDLRTGKLSSHEPKNLITKIVPFDYDSNAKSAVFEKFLATVQPDPIVRKFVQQSIGYSLLGIARERAFWILYGSGNNGKSVFIDLWSEILSDYASSTTSASVMSQKNDRIPNDIARLHGKRFIVIPETEENERINASLIKALSGGDKITARFLFGEFFDFYFSGKLWIATNHKPTITDHSKGFWDRLKIIPFTVDIPKEEVIKKDTLLAQLLADAPAVLNWAVQGVSEYFAADGLEVPDQIQKEIAQYKYEQDSIAQFIDECCDVNPTNTCVNATLYRRYTDFCKDNGEYQRSQRRFTQNLKDRGFHQMRLNSGRYWQGLMLKN